MKDEDNIKRVVNIRIYKYRFVINKQSGNYVAYLFNPMRGWLHLPIAIFYVCKRSRSVVKELYPNSKCHRLFVSFDTNGMDTFNGRFIRTGNR